MRDFRLPVFLFLFGVLGSTALSGQTPDSTAEQKQFEYFDFVPIPEFRGGDTAAVRFFSTYLSDPPKSGFFHREDTVIVSFVAQKGGFISDVRVVRGQRSPQKQAVLNAVNAMPRFTAAESAGAHPRVLYAVAVVCNRRKRTRVVYFFKAGAKNMYYDKEWMSWVRIR